MFIKLFYLFILTQGIICKVTASQSHAAVHQYVHVTGPKGYQALPYTALVNPNYKELEAKHPPANAIPYPGVPQTRPAIEETKPPELPKKIEATLDTNLLNNLAIALQLLIVSNILNMPQDGTQELTALTPDLPMVTPKSELPVMVAPKPELPVIVAQKPELPVMLGQKQEQQAFTIIYKPYDQAPVVLNPYESTPYTIKYENSPTYSDQSISQTYYIKDPINGNYLPTGFIESSLTPSGPTKSTTARKSMILMSPYEALGTALDPIATSKRDLQSPYASILSDNNDLFSLSDLF
ncbi:hypothetical protein K1T71_014253 [Dendrolimus kikuchii]|uniref:Uncharacterized protein n=1 Tax=Dendrolimus kikuchii TaxID=765133 RepID=A0ACC1CFE3_9NEOP|nr:hypothetical protein K1T71_014253 [Dendrolimus kikuchii]